MGGTLNLLVFGSTGQVAQSLAGLSGDGLTVITLGRPDGDITDLSRIRSAIAEKKPDIVVNAAAYTAVDAAETDEDNAYLVNSTGTENLATACAEL